MGLSWGYLRGYIGAKLGLYWGYIRVILGLYWGQMGVILGLYWGYIRVLIPIQIWSSYGKLLKTMAFLGVRWVLRAAAWVCLPDFGEVGSKGACSSELPTARHS